LNAVVADSNADNSDATKEADAEDDQESETNEE